MATDYSYLFQTPNGQVNPLDVDLGYEFANVNNQRNLGISNNIYNGIASGIGAMSGISGIVNAGQSLSRVQDTPGFDYQFNMLQSLGSRDYNDNAGLAGAMAQATFAPRQTYQARRGLTKGQEYGLIGSSALFGAAAGHSIGKNFGVWGDIIGTGVGLIGGAASGVFNMNKGRHLANVAVNSDNAKVGAAMLNNNLTFQSEGEEIADFNHRSHIGTVSARGGHINTVRRQETIQEFRDRVLGKKESILPQRVLCKGGVRIKIKR